MTIHEEKRRTLIGKDEDKDYKPITKIERAEESKLQMDWFASQADDCYLTRDCYRMMLVLSHDSGHIRAVTS